MSDILEINLFVFLCEVVITEFAAGAMENWGLVTYRENALLIKDAATAEVSHKQRVAMVVCHELAHQVIRYILIVKVSCIFLIIILSVVWQPGNHEVVV